jgi:DNA recombination protein RmuC
MPREIYLLTSLIIAGFAVIGFWMSKKLADIAENQKPSEELLEIIKMLQTGSKDDRRVLLESLQRNTNALNERLDNAAKIIAGVQRNIGEMSEIGRGMKDLQEFLQSPKLRGNVGEQVLKELLSQMLPKQSFHLQYSFKSGEKVDAAIKTSAGIIPVDSKFPMENFRKMISAQSNSQKKAHKAQFEKDIKKHVNDISKKYILTEEGTIDYALMYIPSEAVYYEIVNNPKIFEYAGGKRVLPVSPTTFYAYMKAILMSFEGQKIEAKAREILAAIRAIQKDYNKVEDNLSTLQRHLNNAYNMMANVLTSFTQLGQKITSTNRLQESAEDKELPLHKPEAD